MPATPAKPIQASPDKLGGAVQLVGPTTWTYASSRLMLRGWGTTTLTTASRASIRSADPDR